MRGGDDLPRPALGAVLRASEAAGAALSPSALLSLKARNLHLEVEMRHIFGHRVVMHIHTHVRRCLLVTLKRSWLSSSRHGLVKRPTEAPEDQKGHTQVGIG